VGFPIRKSADQSSFAAPHGLSQRITSFIASQRQGIHRMPLRHLIVLMIDTRHIAHATTANIDQKDQFASSTYPKTMRSGTIALPPGLRKGRSDMSFFTMSKITPAISPLPFRSKRPQRRNCCPDDGIAAWWSQTGSNRRPPECKSGALPAEL
jgi:hypothetical protein